MRTITVKGVGKVSVKPDLIVISMGMETTDKDYEKTMEYAAERVELIGSELQRIGFAKDDLKTTSFDVRTDYKSVKDENGNYKSVFMGYVCKHDLEVRFDFNTKRLGQVLSTISTCYAMPEFSVSFTVKDPTAVSDELLQSAAKNARSKAEILCAASGVQLGELESINYSWSEINVYSHSDYTLAAECMPKIGASLANIDIEPEDINVSDTATFVWEIK